MKSPKVTAALLTLTLLIFAVRGSRAHEGTRVIQVHAKRFSFSPAEITVKKGEAVKLVVTSDDVTHVLRIRDLGVYAKASKGHPAEVTINTDEAGDFDGKCAHFCGRGHRRMVFVLHVKD